MSPSRRQTGRGEVYERIGCLKGHGTKAPAAKRTGGIILKSSREIELMRAAGSVVQRVLTKMRAVVRPGVTTGELDAIAE